MPPAESERALPRLEVDFFRKACDNSLGEKTNHEVLRRKMMKKTLLLTISLLFLLLFCACGKEEIPVAQPFVPAPGSYTAEVTLTGGSGKATVDSPALLTVTEEGMTAVIRWSSSSYDYMLVGGEKYLPISVDPVSVFEIPVTSLDAPLTVSADTVAMSVPHEIEYILQFDSSTLVPQ